MCWLFINRSAIRDWVGLSLFEDVSRKICLLLLFFMYLGDLYDCLKRKTRTSDSDSETKSPEGKRVCNELTVVDDTITDSNQEAQELVASSNTEAHFM